MPSLSAEDWLPLIVQLKQIAPGNGVGLLLGMVGTLFCLLSILLYILRKRLSPFQSAGPKRYWLNLHILLGTVGPLLVAGHAQNHLLGFKGLANLAMWGTVVSGLLARYFATGWAAAKARRLQMLKSLEARYNWKTGNALFFLRPAQRRRLQESMQQDPLGQSPGLGLLISGFFMDLQLLWELRRATRMVLRGQKLPGDRRRDNCHSNDRRSAEGRSDDRHRAESGQPVEVERRAGSRSRSLPEAFRETLILQRNLLLLGIHEASTPFWLSIHTGLGIGFLLFLNLHIIVAILFAPEMTIWPLLPAAH